MPPTERPVYRADGQLVNPPSHPPQWAPDLNPYADSDTVDPYANPSSPPRGGAPEMNPYAPEMNPYARGGELGRQFGRFARGEGSAMTEAEERVAAVTAAVTTVTEAEAAAAEQVAAAEAAVAAATEAKRAAVKRAEEAQMWQKEAMLKGDFTGRNARRLKKLASLRHPESMVQQTDDNLARLQNQLERVKIELQQKTVVGAPGPSGGAMPPMPSAGLSLAQLEGVMQSASSYAAGPSQAGPYDVSDDYHGRMTPPLGNEDDDDDDDESPAWIDENEGDEQPAWASTAANNVGWLPDFFRDGGAGGGSHLPGAPSGSHSSSS